MKNEFITVPKGWFYFSYTNGAYEFCVEFCVVEVFKFWVKIRWTME